MARKLVVLVSALCLVVGSAMAVGASKSRASRGSGSITSGLDESKASRRANQHGNPDEHLPGKVNNVELVGRLRLTDTPGGIADVHYYKHYAYLAAWSPECPNGGVHIVDVHDPENPVKVGFLSAGPHDYVGEGVHAIHIDNDHFSGDVLLANHEGCDEEALQGLSLWDITDPINPGPLALHQGDFDTNGKPVANSYHSVLGFTKNDGAKAYMVGIDNDEAGQTDVDIFNISNPGNPKLIAEPGLPSWPAAEVDGNGATAFHHDVWFKHVGGHDVLGVSYWDAGWVFLNVDDPHNPEFLYDTNYPETDLLGFTPPEGNAHQGEWSRNGRFWLGADEDFSPYRSKFEILTGDNAGEFGGGEFGWTVPIAQNFDGNKAEGTTVWGGTGCPEDVNGNTISDRDEVPDAADYDAEYTEGEERILVLTRGTCFLSEKVESGELHGWDMVLIGNHHAGAGEGEFPDAYICGSKGHVYTPTISAGCIGHRPMHLLFNDEPQYDPQPHDGDDLPPNGTVGEDARMTSQFDGWGYLNLYNYNTGEYLDGYAPAVAQKEARSFDSGALTIHEIETDPRKGFNLGYAAWYAVGLKIIGWRDGQLENLGVYRDTGGNDFWGVSLQKRGTHRPLIYMSDRDSGLWIFKYTGPQTP